MYIMITHIFETFVVKLNYNGTPLVRPPLLHKKSGLSRGVASSGVKISTFMLRFTLSSGHPEGVASLQGGPSKGVPL